MADTKQYTAAELRAQADAMEKEAADKNKGRVYVRATGYISIHDGGTMDEGLASGGRFLSDIEIGFLRGIPEFSNALDRVRGEA